jgi:hypothetical protein
MKQIAAVPPAAYSERDLVFIVPRIVELAYTSHSLAPFAHDLGYCRCTLRLGPGTRAHLRAELDAFYARAYGLNRDELRYILDPKDAMGAGYPSETFRVLKNNDIRRYGEYRTARLVLDAWDRMERGEIHDIGTPVIVPTAQPVPAPVDFSVLADGAWANSSAGTDATLAQLAALVRALPDPTPIARIQLAALYALEPRYLTQRLSGADRATWRRLIGPAAEPLAAAVVNAFTPTINANWRNALTQLRGMRAISEDTGAQTWAGGQSINQFGNHPSEWPFEFHCEPTIAGVMRALPKAVVPQLAARVVVGLLRAGTPEG